MPAAARPTGIPSVQELPWGSHLAHFYETRADFIDSVVPFFHAGLTGDEQCVWIATEPFGVAEAWSELRARIPDFERYVRKEQIQVVSHDDGYGAFESGTALDVLVEGCLRREEEALRRGFAGLRISGNPVRIPSASWDRFTEFEEQAHRAFHNRRIIALCSYSLARCGPRQIRDVLHNHGFALVRRQGNWQIADDAQTLLAAKKTPTKSRSMGPASVHPRHDVQFYQSATFLTRRVADYVTDGLARQEAVLVVSEPQHARLVLESVQAAGHDTIRLRESGRLVVLDARATLAQLLVNGSPDEDLFNEVVGGLIADSRASFGVVRAYGEMVNLLVLEGREHEALMLERLWNKLLEREPFSLLCAYALDGFTDATHPESFARVCREHAGVSPAEEPTPAAAGTGQLIAELQHQAKVIDFETRTRRTLERDRVGLTRHLSLLQKVTSALSAAPTPTDVARVAARAGAAALEADDAAIGLVEADGTVRPLASLDAGDLSLAATRLPLAAAVHGKALWLSSAEQIAARYPELQATDFRAIAAFPLLARGRTVGVACFGFSKEDALDPASRALAEDLMRQTGLALDRSLLLQRAEQEHERALRAGRAKDEFMAMLGHELRNPLSPIVTALEVMRLRGVAEHEHERAVIERQVRNLVRLVEDLLDVSRVTSGKVSLHKATVEMGLVVAKAIEMASPLLEQRSHELVVEVPARGLPVEGDEERLAQVLTNLLINAAKYTEPHGRIAIKAERDRGEVRVDVRDTGAGIDPGLLPHLFDLFVQGERPPDRRQGGLGIGLTIARTLVEMHGGTLSAHSDGRGKGSTFTVRIPSPARLPIEDDGAEDVATLASVQARRVLVVDDNRDAADALAYALGVLGHVVRVAYDSPQALRVAAEFQPQLALVDIGLPVMDGYELAERLRAGGRRYPRVVAVTGYGQDSDRERSRAAGFHAHLVKPIDLAEIQALLVDI